MLSNVTARVVEAGRYVLAPGTKRTMTQFFLGPVPKKKNDSSAVSGGSAAGEPAGSVLSGHLPELALASLKRQVTTAPLANTL